MIKNTDNKPISELLSTDHKVSYFIPKYQRKYIWTKWNWESMFDDIEESNNPHFLGSIICINNERDDFKSPKLELVDGQQRMTTVSLLYLAIYKYLSDNLPENLEEKERIKELLILEKLKTRLILSEKGDLRLTPSISNHNLEDYRWTFSENIEEVKMTRKPIYHGGRRISKAFEYFSSRLNAIDSDEAPIYNYESVKEFLDKLNSATMVKIDVMTHADAFILFETLNNRGVPLSAIDIIKNKLLGKLEKQDSSGIDVNFERWNNVLMNLSDDYAVQERFLRQFYNAFKLDKDIAVKNVSKALRSNLIYVYESLIDRNVELIFKRIEQAALIYGRHIQYDNEEYTNKYVKALRNLESVNGTDGYMLLLFIDTKYEIDEEQKIKLVNFLCNYFIRRNVTDSPPTRDLTNLFMEIIEHINLLQEYDFDSIKGLILKYGRPSKDEYFKEKLSGDLYEENVGATRYILSSLESANTETKEKYTNFYAREKGKYIWTVEHIFPQNENIPDHWVDMVADGDKEKAGKVREKWVHKLGNLTLTGYNSQLSNMSLERKQNKKIKDKYVGFKNGLWLNEDIAETSQWKKTNIKHRTGKLVKEAMTIFKLS